MTAAPDDVVAGRFRVRSRERTEERGVDLADGAPVLLAPPPETATGVRFVAQEALETAAHIATSLGSPWVLAVRCASPRVVYDAPPSATRPDAPLPFADAVECALQVCDVLAKAHAAGWSGLATDVHDVRVARAGDGWRATVVLPHLPPRGRFSYAHAHPWWHGPVRRDLGAVVTLLRDLALGRVPAPLEYFGDMSRGWMDPPAVPSSGDAALDGVLACLAGDAAGDDLPADVASLAERLLACARDPAAWAARVAAWPRVARVVERRDWDRLIALGDEERHASKHPRSAYYTLPLAAAWHGRACAAYARGDLDAAERDVERAIELDPFARYLVTRGVLREARGDREGAAADYDRAVASCRREPTPEQKKQYEEGVLTDAETHWAGSEGAAEGARALYARGVLRWKARDAEGAATDLGDALSLARSLSADGEYRQGRRFQWLREEVEPRALRALVPVLRARVAAGAGAEERWSLARVLVDLGRREEARAEADRALALDPENPRLARRRARMFGEPVGPR